MSTARAVSQPGVGRIAPPERRAADRNFTHGDLWLVAAHTQAVLRARCVDVSSGGMRLRVAVGYGIQPGQTYELCSHLPWMNAAPLLGLRSRRRATVRRAQLRLDEQSGEWDVGVSFDAPGSGGANVSPTAGWA